MAQSMGHPDDQSNTCPLEGAFSEDQETQTVVPRGTSTPDRTPVTHRECTLGRSGDHQGLCRLLGRGVHQGWRGPAQSPRPSLLWPLTAGLYRVHLYSQTCSLLTPLPVPSLCPAQASSPPLCRQESFRQDFINTRIPSRGKAPAAPGPLSGDVLLLFLRWTGRGGLTWLHYWSLSPRAPVCPPVTGTNTSVYSGSCWE